MGPSPVGVPLLILPDQDAEADTGAPVALVAKLVEPDDFSTLFCARAVVGAAIAVNATAAIPVAANSDLAIMISPIQKCPHPDLPGKI